MRSHLPFLYSRYHPRKYISESDMYSLLCLVLFNNSLWCKYQVFVNECCEAKFAQFTTITGILDSAEWKFRQRCPSGVNKGHTGFNLSSHFTGMVQIAGEYGSAKAIRGIISQSNGFCLILYLIYFAYRSEYFLVVKRIILINTSNDGRITKLPGWSIACCHIQQRRR